MRRMRSDADKSHRTTAAAELCTRLTACEFFRSAQHIAAYFPHDGEIDIWPVIRHAWENGKTIYLPVLLPANTLGFAMISAETQLDENRYGIPEPRYTAVDMKASTELDLVLMPLVAFDDALYRLGMGGGYYDRTFAFIRDSAKTQPLLVGAGYDFQRVNTVYPETWDVPAWRIVTDKTIYKQVREK